MFGQVYKEHKQKNMYVQYNFYHTLDTGCNFLNSTTKRTKDRNQLTESCVVTAPCGELETAFPSLL